MIQNDSDRRVVRTKRMLRDALADLIEEKGLERITVCDLTERADINRGTFYAHYKDKNDLVESSENEVMGAITRIQETLKQLTIEDLFIAYEEGEPMPFVVSLFDYIRYNGKFVKALMGPKGDPGFQPRLQQIVSENIIRNVLSPKYRENTTPLVNYYVAFYTNAMLGIIKQWLSSGMQESSEEMARIIVAIMYMRPGDAIEMNSGLYAQEPVPSVAKPAGASSYPAAHLQPGHSAASHRMAVN